MWSHHVVPTVAVAAILSTGIARADAQVAGKQERMNVVGVDALDALGWPLLSQGAVLEFPVTFEHAFTHDFSGFGTFSLRGLATSGPPWVYTFTYGVSVGARYYPWGDAPRGLWVGPRVSYSPRDREPVILGLVGSGVRILGEFGYQWILQGGVALGFSLGWDQIGYSIYSASNEGPFPDAVGGLRASFVVGWSF